MTTTIIKLVADSLKIMKRGARTSLLAFSLGLTPAPASRPRVGRFGTYYAPSYERFRKEAAKLVTTTGFPEADGPLEVLVETVIAPPKKGKYLYPKSKGDVDNLAKGPLDAMTKADASFWADDSQIVALHVFKRYARPGEEPGFNIYWKELSDVA